MLTLQRVLVFELSILRSLLLPHRHRWGSSLLALLAAIVISLVVWLVLVFFSVTEGLERAWVGKVTALHGVVRLGPRPGVAVDTPDLFRLTPRPEEMPLTEVESLRHTQLKELIEEVKSSAAEMGAVVVQWQAAPAMLHLDSSHLHFTQPILAARWSPEPCAVEELLPHSSSPAVCAAMATEEQGPEGWPLLAPQVFEQAGARVGDRGYLLYATLGAGGATERSLPVYVAGFYDAGVMPVGGRILFLPEAPVARISGAQAMLGMQRLQGLQVRQLPLERAPQLRTRLQELVDHSPEAEGWSVETYREFDFARELFEQFASDRLLFSLIAVIVLAVASANIVSFLVLMVHEQRQQIGILRAMGARASSMAVIFGGAGWLIGLIGALLGTLLALLTLRYLSFVVELLSAVQGHPAFQVAFFGGALPNTLSHSALFFVWVAAPLLAVCAGWIPAIRASRIEPAQILRNK